MDRFTTFKPHQVSPMFLGHVYSLLNPLSRDNASVDFVLNDAKRGPFVPCEHDSTDMRDPSGAGCFCEFPWRSFPGSSHVS